MSQVHPNYIKASNLILISLLIAFISFFITDYQLSTAMFIGVILFTTVIWLALAYFVRKGYDWIKYLLLAMFVYGTLSGIQVFIANLSGNIIASISFIIQTILQAWVIILLFKVPKPDTKI